MENKNDTGSAQQPKEEERLELDLKKMILYSEILKPKFDE